MASTGLSDQAAEVAEKIAGAPSRERGWPAVAVLLGLGCQSLAIVWIAFSEIPAKVFISSWSVSMPGILWLALLRATQRRVRGMLLAGLALTAVWNLYFAVGRGAPVSPFSLAACMALAVLAAAARPASRVERAIREVLHRRTLLVVYMMVAVSGILTGYGHIQLLVPAVATIVARATPENRWERLHEHLPPWLFPRSPEALRGLFSGESPVPWEHWLLPLAGWFVFLMAAYGTMLCLAAILSEQWISGERLAFPMAQLPLEMTSREHPFFRNRLMWLGFAVPLVVESLLALNYYFPAVPAVEIKHRNFQPFWFPERPWSAMGPFYFGCTPFIVGFAYLAPVDVSFSVWFFNVLAKALRVYGATMGLDAAGGGVMASRFPYPEEQAFGAFLAFALAALGRTWPGIRLAWKERKRRPERSRGMLLALAGFFLCSGVWLVLFVASGLSFALGLLLLALILLVAVTLSRIRAEAGSAWVFGPYRDVTRAIVVAFGSNAFADRELVALSGFRWFSRDVRFLPMPFHLEAFRIAAGGGIRKSAAAALMALATAAGVLLGFYVVLTLSYRLGLGTGKTYAGPTSGAMSIWMQANDWTLTRTMPDTAGLPWIGGGAAFTFFLLAMRSRFLWWPFHPIGYVMAETGAGASFWFHYFVAWLLKGLILRYGGHRLYVRSLPFVFGLILGDLLTQTAWSAFAVLFDLPVYQFIT